MNLRKRDTGKTFNIVSNIIFAYTSQHFPVDTGRKLNVYKTFRRRPGRLLNVLYTFKLRLVSAGILMNFQKNGEIGYIDLCIMFILLRGKIRTTQ